LLVFIFLAVGSQAKRRQGNNYLPWRLRAAKVTTFLGGCQLPRKLLTRRLSTAKKTINLAVVDCQKKLLTWRLERTAKNLILGGRLPIKSSFLDSVFLVDFA
jgi:hypothetical protein